MGSDVEGLVVPTAHEVLTTTRAVRRRLDFQRPVSRDLLLECLQVAVQAPTGSNRQEWQFVFVQDPERKRAVAEHYGRAWDAYAAQPRPVYPEGDVRRDHQPAVVSSARYLRERMHEAPWLMIPCIQGRVRQGAGTVEQAGLWGSIVPAFWSFLLAARARGLGTAYTTLHLVYEREVADVLGIPYDRYTQAGLTPIAYYSGDGFRPAARLPLESVAHWNGW
ncbi:MAG TPA: nitroreductase family protein [Candidatus Dormibacteraeota bacterium]|nr:nitroreductase family protein [Candidatus Dormibacteraeota bacterium]